MIRFPIYIRWSPTTCLLVLASLVTGPGCDSETPTAQQATAPQPQSDKPIPTASTSAASALITLSYEQLAHVPMQLQLSGKNKIGITVNERTRSVETTFFYEQDQNKQFAGWKNTTDAYGVEVVATKDVIYQRLRYGKYLRRINTRATRTQAAALLLDASTAYAQLLSRALHAQPSAQRQVIAGRSLVVHQLSRLPQPASPDGTPDAANAWRKEMKILSVTGAALVDPQTKLAWSVKLDVHLQAPAPKLPDAPNKHTTGIPQPDPTILADMTIHYEHDLRPRDKTTEIAVSPDTDVQSEIGVHRLEIERQMLTQERNIIDVWPQLSQRRRAALP